MTSITIHITDEQAQQIKDVKYHLGIKQREIFLAGLEVFVKQINKIKLATPHG